MKNYILIDESRITLPGATDIYFISDVHSNLPALISVLNSIPLDCTIVCCGDILGYYINPNEVCQLLRERNVFCIKGNHDKYVTGELKYNPAHEKKYRIKEQISKINKENFSWINSLPDEIQITISDRIKRTFRIVHGCPGNAETYLYPNSDLSNINFSEDYLICGHTHHPMMRYINSRWVINPGSVGQPRHRIPGASFVLYKHSLDIFCFLHNYYNIKEYILELEQEQVTIEMRNILTRQ